MLCAVPALRALRGALPHTHITLIGLPWAKNFAQRFKQYIDDFLAYPGFGLPEIICTTEEYFSFCQDAQARHFDIAIQMHGNGSLSNKIVAEIKPQHLVGFTHFPTSSDPHWVPYPNHLSETERLLHLISNLSNVEIDDTLEFPLAAQDFLDRIQQLPSVPKELTQYICIHPGARAATRRWPIERFACVADALVERGFTVILTGTAAEAPITSAIESLMCTACINAASDSSIGALALVIAQASLIICNDTGVSHLAAALKTPSLVIFLGSSVERWAPKNSDLHHRVYHPIECRPCQYQVCPIEHACAKQIEPITVIERALNILQA